MCGKDASGRGSYRIPYVHIDPLLSELLHMLIHNHTRRYMSKLNKS